MRYESTVTSISWIPLATMTGPMRLPMDMGIGRYDRPPPDEIGDLEVLVAEDRFRFANRLSAWVEVNDGALVGCGHSGGSYVGVTTIKLGVGSVVVPAVAYPVIQNRPQVTRTGVRFTQTAGGRPGAPLPRRTSQPPYLRITAPTAWTTLSLTIGLDGTSAFEVAGASPFPRHWIYGADGKLAAKSGVIDFKEWTREHSHDRSPWNDYDQDALVADIESGLERRLSRLALIRSKPEFRSVEAGDHLVRQGEEGTDMYLVLDGMLDVTVGGEVEAEIGPGAVVGERAILEGGVRTATLTAKTPVRVAVLDPALFSKEDLDQVAAGHRREED